MEDLRHLLTFFQECAKLNYFAYPFFTGGGKGIYRVEVSTDGGSTWEPVDHMEQHPDRKSGMFWAWALWEKSVSRIRPSNEIVARACK